MAEIMNRHINVHVDRAMDTRPIVVEVSNPHGPRGRYTFTPAEARDLKDRLATTLKEYRK